MAAVTVNGVDLHTVTMSARHPRRPAAAPTVVCVHGLILDSLASFYFTLANPLVDAGFDVVMYDLRGHGASSAPATGYRLQDHVADLLGLADALAAGRPVHLIGNSFGGTIALAAAATNPSRVAGVVAVEGFPPTPAWAVRLRGLMQDGLEKMRQGPTAGHGPRALAPRRARAITEMHSRWETTSIIEDVAEGPWVEAVDLTGLSCPLLALYGEASTLTADSPDVLRLLPDSEVRTLPGHGHFMLVEAHREVAGHVVPWLDRLSTGTRVRPGAGG